MTLERCRMMMMMMMMTVTKNAAATVAEGDDNDRVLEGKRKGVSDGPTQNTV
jgi:hypothetical protein